MRLFSYFFLTEAAKDSHLLWRWWVFFQYCSSVYFVPFTIWFLYLTMFLWQSRVSNDILSLLPIILLSKIVFSWIVGNSFCLKDSCHEWTFFSFWNKVIKFGCVYMYFSAEFIEAQSLFLEPSGLIDLNNPADLVMIRERIKLPKFKVWVSLPTPKIAESPYLSLPWLAWWYWKKGKAWLWRLQKGMQYLNFK